MYYTFTEMRQCLEDIGDDSLIVDAYINNFVDEDLIDRRSLNQWWREALDALVTVDGQNRFDCWEDFVESWVEEHWDELFDDGEKVDFDEVSADLQDRYDYTDEGYVFRVTGVPGLGI